MHLLIILVVVVWIGIALSRTSTRQHLLALRAVGIAILTVLGLLVVTTILYFAVNDMFALEFFFSISAVGVVGGLVWLVVKLGKVTKSKSV